VSALRHWFHTVYYWLNVKTWVRLVVTINVRRRITGLEHIPRKGALILASNHLNVADPPMLTAVTPRRIAWLTKRELFDIPVVGVLYHLFGCLPVRRFSADLQALRLAQDALKRGLVLGMFPEGTRSLDHRLGEGEPGTALLAMRTNTPILPTAVWGTENMKLPRDFFRRTTIHVAYGEPFTLPRPQRIDKKAVEEGTRIIMQHIAALLPERYRGVYADRGTDAVESKGAR
jgi:1-acyl-sn-glycerol-3-phosphate acyltransferase